MAAQRRARGLVDLAPRTIPSQIIPAALVVLGAVALAALSYIGRDFYFAGQAARQVHPLFETLSPKGLIGHTAGIWAFAFAVINFLYFVRKELSWLRGKGHLRT